MKMERRPINLDGDEYPRQGRWFPYLDKFSCESSWLNSGEVLDALDPLILDSRKERFKNVVRHRSYSVCLVVEGLSDFGNVSAAFRSADALGFQSVHVVSCDASKRCKNDWGEIVFEYICLFPLIFPVENCLVLEYRQLLLVHCAGGISLVYIVCFNFFVQWSTWIQSISQFAYLVLYD